MSADVQEGSSTRPRSRTASRRLEGSTSSTFSSNASNAFEISSAELFVKIPPANAHPAHLETQRPARKPESGRPSRPSRSTKRFPAMHEEDENLPPETQPGHARKRTLSSGDASTRHVVDARRGRQTRSENGDDDWSRRARVLSLPRQAFKTGSISDSSEQPSPLTPSVFNDIPPMPIFSNRRFTHRHQDSGATQQSNTSSSIYPRSSSTGTESYMSVPSLPSNDADHHIITVDPNDPDEDVGMREVDEMDADDVSYRLRLLMQNNYYLPPAHLKPFDYSPVSESPKKSPKSSSSPTTFLDLFRVGKLRSSPKTSKGVGPILRATGDDSTVSGIGRPQHIRPPANQAQHLHLHFNSLPARPRPDNNKKGRVVVVRERMEDIAKVAKQVEQDLKLREAERKKTAQPGGSRQSAPKDADELDLSNDSALIDPTDCVDLPPLSSDAFLDPHAAALSRMAMDGGINASVLADQLPPHSPGMWSFDSEEEAWRKALLQEAVGHSLNNTPMGSPHRTPSGHSPFRNLPLDKSRTPTPLHTSGGAESGDGNPIGESSAQALASPLVGSEEIPDDNGRDIPASGLSATTVAAPRLSVPRRKRELGQRILSRMIDEDEINNIDPTAEYDSDDGPELAEGSKIPRSEHGLRVTSLGSINFPGRAETPTLPIHPLAPPPRKTGAPLSPVWSTNVPDDSGIAKGQDLFIDVSDNLLQSEDRDVDNSTDPLEDTYETHVGLSSAFGGLSPPAVNVSPSSDYGRLSSHGASASAASISSGSRYSEDEEDQFHTPLENNTAVHLPDFDNSRPSLTISITPSDSTSSEYSRPSPTISAFRDALERNNIYSGEESRRESVANTLGRNSFVNEEDKLSRVPSRVSDTGVDSRFATVSPPPRTSSSLAHNVLYPPPLSRYQLRPQGTPVTSSAHRASMDTVSERSITPDAEPSTPLASQRMLLPLSDEGEELREPSLRSELFAPSPISFFDAVEAQNQPADESDDDDDDEDDATQVVSVGNEDLDDEDEDEEEDSDDNLDDEDEDGGLLGNTGGYQSDAATKPSRFIVDPVSRSVRNVPRDPRMPLGNIVTHSLGQLRNHSSPHLVRPSRTMSDIGHGRPSFQDGRPPLPKAQSSVGNFSLSKLRGKGKEKDENEKDEMSKGDSFLMMNEAPPRRSTSSSVFDRFRQHATAPPAVMTIKKPRPRAPTVSAGVSSDYSGTPPPSASTFRPPNRPWTAGPGSSSTSVHTWREDQSKQDESMRRLDGMVIEHMERERDILKRITTTLAKS